MPKPPAISQRIARFVGSRRFFWGIVGLLVLQAAWIALSGRYPMAFDEDFHLGIIRFYAHHLSPFWAHQPAGADMFGAVARDPSYLYHYLMSFPYRLLSVLTHDQTIQILGLRTINIGLFAASLAIYRRLLLTTGASKAIVHSCLLLFVLIPVVPLLAAQINYDNLFLPLSGLTLLLTVQFTQELRRYKRIDTQRLALLIALSLLACLVKYAFLPLFIAIVAAILIGLRRTFRSWRKLGVSLLFGATLITRRMRWVLLVLLVLSSGLFVERYGINMVRYHNPLPDCSKVLSIQQCSAYGPWIRDYNFEINKLDTSHHPAAYTDDWLKGMWLRLFFAVDGPSTQFQTRGPLTIPALSAIVFGVAGLMLVLAYGRRVLARYEASVLWFLGLTTIFYVAVLWLDEYRAFARTGQPVAINGRYLFPILLPALVIAALAASEALRKRRPALKVALLSTAVLCLLWGGGVLTYILRSSDSWYWPNHTVRTINHTVQRTLGPLTPGYRQPTQFL